eukprot:snap_masked-scaffold1_size3401120-processed-gene-1.35 protein:Tk04850 transcript:snap_masked-scaffold1_size3401120-processed-gene-1.35-mRNA-1 annotation:"carnitine dehydratase"
MGADVVRLERRQGDNLLGIDYDVLNRGKRSVAVDLKSEQGFETALELLSRADVLIEGFRPGVMERLELGPEDCWEANPALVYARMTGWGQDGPLASSAGHDINYIALSGALSAFGDKDGKPVMPVNLLGDFGGGALYLAFGIMAAVYEAKSSGKGQVVDAAISDCTAHLSTMLHGLMFNNRWQDQRGSNLLDGGAHHYNSYRCADDNLHLPRDLAAHQVVSTDHPRNQGSTAMKCCANGEVSMTDKRPQAVPTVQLDNDKVLVTEWRFPPGGETGWHRHGMDYVVVPQTTGQLLIELSDGEMRADLTTGVAYARVEGTEHNVVNDNDFEFVFVEVELK